MCHILLYTFCPSLPFVDILDSYCVELLASCQTPHIRPHVKVSPYLYICRDGLDTTDDDGYVHHTHKLIVTKRFYYEWVSQKVYVGFKTLLCCLHCSLRVQRQACTVCVTVKQFRPWTASCVLVVVATWRVPFPYARKNNSVQWSDFCGLKVYQGQKSI
jgi:hypothetical protein